mgnify:CR=1 FL=1
MSVLSTSPAAPRNWDAGVKALHWSMALLIPLTWVLAVVREDQPRETAIKLMMAHKSVGLVVFALLDALVDLPFALPTAVAGISLAALYAPNGWIGALLAPLGIKIAFTPLGIVVALVFVGLPFVVRTVQPVMEELDREVEEASATLGASRFQTLRMVVLPALTPAILTGFALAFARGVGEYGSVIFIAGNIPYVSEIAPLLIVIRLEEFNYAGATAIACIMLVISFAMLLFINLLQMWSRRRYANVR